MSRLSIDLGGGGAYTSINIRVAVVQHSNMVRFMHRENVQLLHHMTSSMGVSLRTSCKKIARIDKETLIPTGQLRLLRERFWLMTVLCIMITSAQSNIIGPASA